jgi:hypothetical protein
VLLLLCLRDGELLSSGLGGEENCVDVETKIDPSETTQACQA